MVVDVFDCAHNLYRVLQRAQLFCEIVKQSCCVVMTNQNREIEIFKSIVGIFEMGTE